MLRATEGLSVGRSGGTWHRWLAASAAPSPQLEPHTERRLRRAWALTGLTTAWNSLEAIIAIVSSLVAGSIALVGFGLDSDADVAAEPVASPMLKTLTNVEDVNGYQVPIDPEPAGHSQSLPQPGARATVLR